MSEYKFEIYSRRQDVVKHLKNSGFSVKSNKNVIAVCKLDKNKIRYLKKYCKKLNLKYNLINTNFERNSNYRQAFFASYQPTEKGDYFCAYCGRLVPKNEVTVDHIIPIYSVKYSPAKQKLLTKIGIRNINCKKNLAPACRKCNIYKGTKGGLWIIAGELGKKQKLWYFRHVVRFIGLNIFLYFIFSNFVFF